jgi:type IV secretion system protein TrbL
MDVVKVITLGFDEKPKRFARPAPRPPSVYAPKPAKDRKPLDPVWKGFLPALFLIVLFASVSEAASMTTSAEFTDSMLQNFKDKFASYENNIWLAALTLFGSLFLCQFTWSMLQLCLHESLTFGAIIALVVRQVMVGMFFWWPLFDRSILRSIVSSFSELAGSGLSLSELLYIMENSVQKIMTAVGNSSGISDAVSLFLTGLFASVIMSFALTTAIAYMAVVMIENYIVGSLGLILMGFGGSDYTRNYAVSYIHTLVHVGLKLFLASTIVRIGVLAFADATTGLNNLDSESISQICMQLIAQSFFFLAVTKVVPEVAGSLVSGVSSTGTRTMSAIGMAAGAMLMGTAARTYNAPGVAADFVGGASDVYSRGKNAVESAANAYSSQYEQSLSKNSNPVMAKMSAVGAGMSVLGGALWGAYQETRGHKAEILNANSMTPPPGDGRTAPDSGETTAAASQTVPPTERSDPV